MKVMLDKYAYMPEYAHKTDAGMDLRSPINCIVFAGNSKVIDTGVHIELPLNTVGMLKSKSGLNVNYGITSEGVIDEGYSGSIQVKLYNHGDRDYAIKRGDKISQLVVMPCVHHPLEQVDEIKGKDRGNNGFGSTGR